MDCDVFNEKPIFEIIKFQLQTITAVIYDPHLTSILLNVSICNI